MFDMKNEFQKRFVAACDEMMKLRRENFELSKKNMQLRLYNNSLLRRLGEATDDDFIDALLNETKIDPTA